MADFDTVTSALAAFASGRPVVVVDDEDRENEGDLIVAADLARLAGLQAAGLPCEIVSEDGPMARRDERLELARTHELKAITIADLVRHRYATESLVRRIATTRMPARSGSFTANVHATALGGEDHLALVKGDLESCDAPLVRVHSECLGGDVLGPRRCDCGDQLDRALGRSKPTAPVPSSPCPAAKDGASASATGSALMRCRTTARTPSGRTSRSACRSTTASTASARRPSPTSACGACGR